MSSSSGDVPGKLLIARGAQDGLRNLVGVEADGGVAAGLQHGSDDFLHERQGGDVAVDEHPVAGLDGGAVVDEQVCGSRDSWIGHGFYSPVVGPDVDGHQYTRNGLAKPTRPVEFGGDAAAAAESMCWNRRRMVIMYNLASRLRCRCGGWTVWQAMNDSDELTTDGKG